MGKTLTPDKELVGQILGDLEVLRRVGYTSHGVILYECKCLLCGNIVQINRTGLKYFKQKQCRECSFRIMGEKKHDNLVGKRFGLLAVRDWFYDDTGRYRLYLCKCECGNLCSLYQSQLTGNRRKQDCTVEGQSCKIRGNPYRLFEGCGELSLLKLCEITKRAHRRNLGFDLTAEYLWNLYLEQERKCWYTGVELNMIYTQQDRRSCTASLDRTDNKIGYLKGNVRWVHKDVNFIKYTNTEKEFFTWVEKIANYRFQNDNFAPKVLLSKTEYNRIKYNAGKRNLVFDVSSQYLSELFISQCGKCGLSGEDLEFSPTTQKSKTTASLDRIDSNIGYIDGNVMWVHKMVNRMKKDFTNHTLIDWCKKIHNYRMENNNL